MSLAILARPRAVRLHASDHVATALEDLGAGEDCGLAIALEPIPRGHKIALAAIPEGAEIRKYGQVIGRAKTAIPAGGHVHVHNVEAAEGADAVEIGVRATALPPHPAAPTFQGFRRANGKAGTRNYVGILTTVNCSATVARKVAERFAGDRLAAWPHVDGVVALTHTTGCGTPYTGDGVDNLQRTLGGFARHPNFAGVLLIGLGCEVNQMARLLAAQGLAESETLRTLVIQEEGGTLKTIARGIEIVGDLLSLAETARREPIPASELVLALQCGGSDAWSGVTANPALGAASDLLVRCGGKAILAETPEIFGAERLLLARAARAEVADALLARLDWWRDHAARNDAELNNNPSPGNIKGGLTTILEKSLGAVAKGGAAPLVDVVRYAEPVTRPGLSFMDSPGYDPCSVTGEIASGATVVCFTTGRGSVFGAKPAPSLKLLSNSPTAAHLEDDVDIDCGPILSGEVSIDEMGARIFDRILAIASGEQSKSEALGFGDLEFVPWQVGAWM